jgi:hypothetical protein
MEPNVLPNRRDMPIRTLMNKVLIYKLTKVEEETDP